MTQNNEQPKISQKRYETLVQSINGIVWEAEDDTLTFTFVSKQAERILGYPVEQWINESNFWANHIHPDDRERIVNFCHEAEARRENHTLEYRMIAANGNTVWFADNIAMTVLDDGRIFWGGIMVDITEQKKTNEALVQSEARYRTLVENAPEALVVFNGEEGVFEDVSVNACHLFKASREELLKMGPADISPQFQPDGRPSAETAVDNIRRVIAGESLRFEWMHRDTEGNDIPCEVYFARLPSHDKVLVRGSVIDISHRKRAEDENKKLLHELSERVKELTALHATTRILQEVWTDTEALLREIASLLPPAFQYPEVAAARISLGNVHAQTPGFSDSYPMLVAQFTTSDSQDGKVEVVYTAERPPEAEGPFVAEERALINTVADMLRVVYDRRRASGALRESEERYREMVENAHDIIYSHDLDGNYISANKAAERILGYTQAEALKLNLTHTVAPEHIEMAEQMVVDKLGGEEETIYDIELLTKDGRRIAVEVNTRLVIQDGRPVAVQGIARDVTERKRTEDELRESQRRFSDTLTNLDMIAVMTDGAGTITFCNDYLLRLTGWELKDAIGKNWFEMFIPEDERPKVTGLLEDIPVDGSVTPHFENEIKTRTGERRLVKWTNTTLRGLDGGVVGVAALGDDITNLKKAQEALQKSEEQLRQAQKMEAIGQLAGGIAHDFNNILTAIIGYSQLAVRGMRKDDPLRYNIQEIERAGERAASLTRQLLAFSRKQILQPKILDLNSVVAETQKMLVRLLGEDVAIHTALDPAAGRVKADPGQIEQVIINLAVNARDAMPTGGRLTIETGNMYLDEDGGHGLFTIVPGPYVVLSVTDTGVGMDEDTQSHVFEPFFTTKETGKGTGLGLSTVYGIVKQSDGYVWLTSVPGKGTRFDVYLPRVDQAVQDPRPHTTDPGDRSSGSETILLVEDDSLVRALVMEVLESRGYNVLEAEGGDPALNICRQLGGSIDLLLTDVIMPGMSGRELRNRMAEMCPDVKVLFMSGYTDDAIVRHRIHESDMPFLQKPFSPDALAQKVREILDGD